MGDQSRRLRHRLGSHNLNRNGVELWGGVECTVNRIGDRFLDQWRRSGHAERTTDFDRIASLGIRTLRQSVLWERVAPDRMSQCDWSQSDEALGILSELQIEPIVGLLHHGSGPSYTHLLDPRFPQKLARYAREVAERYPHVRMFTPVNEPMTTARFSALYGHWYPHARDPRSFALAFLNQIKGTVLAMREIRDSVPDAMLVQTEDLGKTYATEELQDQAEFENDRRWATWDLLCGTFDGSNRLYRYFRKLGIEESELVWFRENPYPPGILGVNTYVTSERFIDHRLDRYPMHTHGGNGKQSYADVEAVRVLAGGIDGPRGLMEEVWKRYRRPFAITECHLNCTREEQVRWLLSVWEAANDLRETGVGVKAVTAWSLFGAYDWNSLLCEDTGCYEPGAFDLRGPLPRETALGAVLRRLAFGKDPQVAWTDGPGWWDRPIRLEHPPVVLPQRRTTAKGPEPDRKKGVSSPILIVGAGAAARAFGEACETRGLLYRQLAWPEVDCSHPTSIEAIFGEHMPWAVVNATGTECIEDADRNAASCFRENTLAAMLLAHECARRQIRLLALSTDQVFDGKQTEPYVESDMPWPTGNYGRSKWEAEYRIVESGADALIIRAGACFGPQDKAGFLVEVAEATRNGRLFGAPDDRIVTPAYLPDLADHALDLLQDGEKGLWHLAHPEPVSWFQFARLAACAMGTDASRVRSTSSAGKSGSVHSLALTSERGNPMPSLENALARWATASAPDPAHDASIFFL